MRPSGWIVFVVVCLFYAALLQAAEVRRLGVGDLDWSTDTANPALTGWVNVRAYGADGTGVIDSDSAFATAMATGNPVFVPAGTYSFARRFSLDNISLLIGVPGKTIIKPKNTVTGVFLNITNNTFLPTIIQSIVLDGSLTSGATGIKVGSNAVTSDITFKNVTVSSFKYGMSIDNVVNMLGESVYFTNNGTALYINASGDPFPTTVTFIKSKFRESKIALNDGIGVYITHGYNIRFDDCIFESNDKEGIKIKIGSNQKANVSIYNSWFENNQSSERSPNNFFHIVADGSGYGTHGRISLILRDNLLNYGGSNAKNVSLDTVFDFDISNPRSGSGEFNAGYSITHYSYGKISFPYSLIDYGDAVIDVDNTSIIDSSSNLHTRTLTVNSPTPSVLGARIFKTATTDKNTIIWKFTQAHDGQRVIVLFQDNNTTINFTAGSTFRGNSGSNWSPKIGDWMECVYNSSLGKWYCSVNKASQ